MKLNGKILLLTLLLGSCKSKHALIYNGDLLTQSFHQNNIEYMYERRCLDTSCMKVDTIVITSTFDRLGNLSERISPAIHQRFEYNQNKFMTRMMTTSGFEHFLFRYEKIKPCVILKHHVDLPYGEWDSYQAPDSSNVFFD
jgi:hypothetical protein